VRLFSFYANQIGERLRPLLEGTFLSRNYLIAQQLPASSPKASHIIVLYFDANYKSFFEKVLAIFHYFSMIEISYFQCLEVLVYVHAYWCLVHACIYPF
jgi:hypothetical protein